MYLTILFLKLFAQEHLLTDKNLEKEAQLNTLIFYVMDLPPLGSEAK